jgi:hypothetical protein
LGVVAALLFEPIDKSTVCFDQIKRGVSRKGGDDLTRHRPGPGTDFQNAHSGPLGTDEPCQRTRKRSTARQNRAGGMEVLTKLAPEEAVFTHTSDSGVVQLNQLARYIPFRFVQVPHQPLGDSLLAPATVCETCGLRTRHFMREFVNADLDQFDQQFSLVSLQF